MPLTSPLIGGDIRQFTQTRKIVLGTYDRVRPISRSGAYTVPKRASQNCLLSPSEGSQPRTLPRTQRFPCIFRKLKDLLNNRREGVNAVRNFRFFRPCVRQFFSRIVSTSLQEFCVADGTSPRQPTMFRLRPSALCAVLGQRFVYDDSRTTNGRLPRQAGKTNLGNMAASYSERHIGARICHGHLVCERKTSAMRRYRRSTVPTGTNGRGSWRAQNETLRVSWHENGEDDDYRPISRFPINFRIARDPLTCGEVALPTPI